MARLPTKENYALIKGSFETLKILCAQIVYSWYTYIKDMILKEIDDYKKLSSCKTTKEVKYLRHSIKVEISNHHKNLFENDIEYLIIDVKKNKLFSVHGFLKMDAGRKLY